MALKIQYNSNLPPIFVALTVQNAVIHAKVKFKCSLWIYLHESECMYSPAVYVQFLVQTIWRWSHFPCISCTNAQHWTIRALTILQTKLNLMLHSNMWMTFFHRLQSTSFKIGRTSHAEIGWFFVDTAVTCYSFKQSLVPSCYSEARGFPVFSV